MDANGREQLFYPQMTPMSADFLSAKIRVIFGCFPPLLI
ncbi:MAG: hypothetical protein ACI8QI_001070 [Limisphaerales bacterium]|jgi:hypothetical protein